MKNLIEDTQRKIDNYIFGKLQSSTDSDDTDVEIIDYKIIREILSELISKLNEKENYMRKTSILNSGRGVDAYCEAILNKMFEIYKTQSPIIEHIPLHAIILCLLQHPYAINFVYSYISTDERNQLMKELRETVLDMFGNNENVEYFDKLFQINSDTDKTVRSAEFSDVSSALENKSVFCLFNYFIGYHFIDELYCKTWGQIIHYLKNMESENKPEKFNVLLIHASYNLNELHSIVIYNEVPQNRKMILDDRNIKSFAPWTFPKNIKRSEISHEILDSYLNSQPQNNSEVQIENSDSHKSGLDYIIKSQNSEFIICYTYDDNPNLKETHFTVLMKHGSPFVNQKEVEDMLNGVIIKYINDDMFENYCELRIYELTHQHKEDISELIDPVNQIIKIMVEIFNEPDTTKENIVDKIKECRELDPFFKHEREIFNLYIKGITDIPHYNIKTFVKYIKDYYDTDYDSNIKKWHT
jgi:hypothetical protein